MKHFLRLLPALLFGLLGTAGTARASHFYGADLFYTHVSGNTYQVSFVVYGDCSGSAFPLLQGGAPQVEVYNGTQLHTTLTLSQNGPGVEVTPVCPSQVNNTTCNGGSVPGVKRYTYTAQTTLNGTSANWRFVTNGNMGNNSLAGRSNSITNIVPGTAGSIMILEATLNNTGGSNSSPTYTTIPTPFFCINKPAQYNPGAVDPNGDQLGFALVDGLQITQTNNTVTNVTYQTGYSATAPLAVQAGTFSFSATTGQLAFTPNIVQQSLVVSRVSEYRNGVLVGTSMREMTFVVLNNCNNNPPGGAISNPIGGTATGNTTIQVCQSQGLFSFAINPIDVDGDPINISAAGLPTGATFTITGNNTTTPTTTFSWNVSNVPAGAYTFFVTYTDNGCPLSSKQTVAYTINVLPTPTIGFIVTQAPTCTKRAAFTASTGGSLQQPPFTFTFLQGSTTVLTLSTAVSYSVSDSLLPGTYTIRVTNSQTCFKDTTITILPPQLPAISATTTPPTCNGGANGSITISPLAGLAPYQYALGAGPYGTTTTFTGLASGSYVIHIKDANDCLKDTTVTIAVTPPINAAISLVEPPCNAFQSGSITVNGVN
ncbi:MAG TPA: SprB repeat-containing protein, partial [Fibrella sp.]